ncbi:hypothetical protein G7Z17_g118 [Cylindrodendrum hubeiense]|uniref:Nephrocystin 3-like N-terminal domain-containing protein n=1 Tax=Cylindrodendrum hubeiense TaxID=595255 RepID=A0A9P5HQN7_9HYPO|nr:hypothetical protein G7Z17_g118 [Cylindrodendrum hubeiense]
MPSPEPPRQVTAENKGSGTQPLHQGDGDLGVLKGDNGVQNLIRTQKVYNIYGPSSQMAELIHQGDDTSDLPSRVAIIEWLKPESKLDFRAHHQILADQMVTGTGTWALEGDGFKQWVNIENPSKFFWIYGILGSGKSMLSSLIIDSLQKATEGVENTACIYVYFQDGQDQPSGSRQEQRPTYANIFMNLLIQLLQCRKSEEVAKELQDKYEHWLDLRILPTPDDYINLFNLEIATFQKVYLVVEGLDNCQNSVKENTRDKIQDALSSVPDNVKVLVTSRGGFLDTWGLQEVQKFELQPKRDDVEKYIRSRIREDRVLQREIAKEPDPDFEATVVNKVADATGGIFLLAKLHMDSLGEQGTLGGIKSALETLPDTVHSAFETSIMKIKIDRKSATKKYQFSLAQHVLTWVVLAGEPLNSTQICHSFAITRSTNTLNKDFLPAEADLVSVCAGLVTMDSKTKVLSLVHESVLNYLWSHSIVQKGFDMDVAKLCLRYLLFDESELETERPLLSYAARYWFNHFSLEEKYVDVEAEDLVMAFLKDDEKVRTVFQIIADGRTALHWAAKEGRGDLVELLAKKSADTNIQDRKGDTPLHLALMSSTKDCTDVVHQLVKAAENQADIDTEDEGWTSLREAMDRERHDIVDILLKKGVDINRPSSVDGWIPLRMAAQNGDVKMVRRLLSMGARVDARDDQTGYSPLRWAIYHNRQAVVQLLLDHGADADDKAKDGSTALMGAVTSEKTIVWMLLEHGAKPDAQNDRGQTALHYAVKNKLSSVIWILVMSNVPVALRDKRGNSCLDLAVQGKDLSVVWLLCENGARADDANADGMTALHLASFLGHLEIVRYFLDRKVDAKVKDGMGDTALHRAVKKKHKDLAGLLTSRGGVAEIQDKDGLTALSIAMQSEDPAMIQVLLDNGASGDVQNKDGLTVLHQALGQKYVEGIRFLLTKSTNPDVKDKEGYAALHRAVLLDNEDIVTALVEGGADINIQDEYDRTPLILAAQTGKVNLVSVLLGAGADVNARSNNGWTAIVFAGRQNVIEGLLRSAGGTV